MSNINMNIKKYLKIVNLVVFEVHSYERYRDTKVSSFQPPSSPVNLLHIIYTIHSVGQLSLEDFCFFCQFPCKNNFQNCKELIQKGIIDQYLPNFTYQHILIHSFIQAHFNINLNLIMFYKLWSNIGFVCQCLFVLILNLFILILCSVYSLCRVIGQVNSL